MLRDLYSVLVGFVYFFLCFLILWQLFDRVLRLDCYEFALQKHCCILINALVNEYDFDFTKVKQDKNMVQPLKVNL